MVITAGPLHTTNPKFLVSSVCLNSSGSRKEVGRGKEGGMGGENGEEGRWKVGVLNQEMRRE